jgi:hypothetical protein
MTFNQELRFAVIVLAALAFIVVALLLTPKVI